jgi:hypothetical protein
MIYKNDVSMDTETFDLDTETLDLDTETLDPGYPGI